MQPLNCACTFAFSCIVRGIVACLHSDPWFPVLLHIVFSDPLDPVIKTFKFPTVRPNML